MADGDPRDELFPEHYSTSVFRGSDVKNSVGALVQVKEAGCGSLSYA